MYFLAYSNNPEVRRYATSGGFTKELLAYALRSGYVDYLTFPRMRGTATEIVVTQDPAELFTKRTNSVYDLCNPLEGLSRIPAGKTTGITLLPCMTGARRLPQVGLVVELLCDYSQAGDFARRVCLHHDIDPESVTSFTHRTGTWPGKTEIVTAGNTHVVPFKWASSPTKDGAPKKCHHCGRIPEQGDIAVADPWGLDRKWSNPGRTLVRIQNPDVLDLIHGANVVLEEITVHEWDKSLSNHIRRRLVR